MTERLIIKTCSICQRGVPALNRGKCANCYRVFCRLCRTRRHGEMGHMRIPEAVA